ncbi:hypothetical protein A3Q56_08258 [Intoshia linei]|uniref:Tr-type G domain-containing protein n=1 Tax=Intoshia linei TaxID=1819745 RepID=A0A177AQA3_9BILA|nr:hypothetical protein A3Q56_08258 [Intoshia linei]
MKLYRNYNVGIMGHVDSGKTRSNLVSNAKLLTTVQGTACFDKSPQSQDRQITIDLGFSSFEFESEISSEAYRNVDKSHFAKFSISLVDCPGHASLMKTIICAKIKHNFYVKFAHKILVQRHKYVIELTVSAS